MSLPRAVGARSLPVDFGSVVGPSAARPSPSPPSAGVL